MSNFLFLIYLFLFNNRHLFDFLYYESIKVDIFCLKINAIKNKLKNRYLVNSLIGSFTNLNNHSNPQSPIHFGACFLTPEIKSKAAPTGIMTLKTFLLSWWPYLMWTIYSIKIRHLKKKFWI